MSALPHKSVFLVLVSVAMLCGCRSSFYNTDGVKQFEQGQYQQAMDSFQQAVAANPQNADAYYNMAATLHDWGRQSRNKDYMAKAETLYHRCLDLSPDHVDCYRALAVLLVDTDRKESAFTLLERWANRAPALADPQVELARLYEEFGDDGAAKQYLARAVDVDSGSSRAWAALGQIREEEGRYAQALTNYQHAYNLNRYHPGIPQRMAAVQQRMAGGSGTLAALPRPTGEAARMSRSNVDSDWVAR